MQYGLSPIVVTLDHVATELRVSVTDGGHAPRTFDRRLVHDPTAARGRGLAIVALLVAARGIWTRQPESGKTVWCRLDATDAQQDRWPSLELTAHGIPGPHGSSASNTASG